MPDRVGLDLGVTVPRLLATVVLTHNEEANLDSCLSSLTGLPGDVFVIDSGSTDGTVEIAERHGAAVFLHTFESHARQWRWALDNLPGPYEWVLGLDADQSLTPELRAELGSMFGHNAAGLNNVDGFYICRRQIFRGGWIRHGGYYPKYLLKLFRHGKVRFDELDLMDHHFYVDGPTAKLHADLIEDNRKEYDLAFWIEKHSRYAGLHAREELLRRQQRASWKVWPRLLGNPDQHTVWLKERWFRLPLYVRPWIFFLYRYVLQRGFLDGRAGFLFHFMQTLWYRTLVDAHLDAMLAAETQQPPKQ